MSDRLTTGGTAVIGQIEHGQVTGPGAPTVTVTPAAGVSRLPLSSAARLRIVTVPFAAGVQV